MLRPFQPALFESPPAPRPLRERLHGLALIANAACLETAATVAREAALAWWDASVIREGAHPSRMPAAPCPGGGGTLPPPAQAEAAALGQDLAALPVADACALLGRLYTQALPREHRTAQGVFYTPSALVRHLYGRCEAAGWTWAVGRVLDPACGAGAFLVEAASRMRAALPDTEPGILLANIGSRLRGWEIDPVAAWLAQIAVEILLLPQAVASGRRLGAVTEAVDTLGAFAPFRGAWDLVIGNPPFGKVKDTPALRAAFRRSLYGHPNLYGLFMDVAVHLAKPERGIVAYLTPASFLAGQYFRRVRSLLAEAAPPVSIDLIESRADVFDEVLQEVVLSVFQRGRTCAAARCAAVHVAPEGLRIESTGPFHLPVVADEPWLLPRTRGDAALVARLRTMPDRLSDWGYEVSTGPLVWNRHKPQLHDTPTPGCVPVVWAEAVTADGRFVLRASKRGHQAWFTPRGADDPNVVRRGCILVQRTTAKEQQRRLIAAEMPASLLKRWHGVAVENHLNMVRAEGGRPKMPLRTLAAFLRTGAADRVLRCISGSVAVSASELAAMPLPPAEAILRAAQAPDFDRLVRRMYGIAGS